MIICTVLRFVSQTVRLFDYVFFFDVHLAYILNHMLLTDLFFGQVVTGSEDGTASIRSEPWFRIHYFFFLSCALFSSFI